MGIDYSCKTCGYLWTSRKTIGMPSVCPNCRSRNFGLYEPALPKPTSSFGSFTGMSYTTMRNPKKQPNLISLYGTEDDFRRCPLCHHTVAVDDTVCDNCGYKLASQSPEVEMATDEQMPPTETIRCPKCNHSASDKDILCNKCGYLFEPRF